MKIKKKKLIVNGLNKAKNFLGNAYNNTKGFLGSVDNAGKMFKQAYSIAAPLTGHSGGANNGLHANILKGLNGYGTIRTQAMEHHDRIGENINTFKTYFS